MISEFYLREMGLEPTREYTHKILSLACLPIPAFPQKAFIMIQEYFIVTT